MRDNRTGDRWGSSRVLVAVAIFAATLALASCGSSGGQADDSDDAGTGGDAQSPVVIDQPSLVSGDRIPVPRGEPVVTLTGQLEAANRGSTVELDLATLQAMGLIKVRVYEPWAKKDLEFRAVDLADVLDVAGALPQATSVHLTALDDYEVDLTMTDVRDGGVLVATASGNGRELPIDKGGPTRIIFTDGTEAGAASEQWIWSIKTIDVR
ncbi:MAG TPA: molybdopterin-dependent oxidoreductase [Thermomicrobiales bacterium]|nr:molybdopterin-dependent oxidoreductase [Thermomicrobiales bacterium]